MRPSTKMSDIFYCPSTYKALTETQYFDRMGFCPHCGHYNHSTTTHANKAQGKWVHPSKWEWFCGMRKEFIVNSDQPRVYGRNVLHEQDNYQNKLTG